MASPFETTAARSPQGEGRESRALLAMTGRGSGSNVKHLRGCESAFSRHALPELCVSFRPLIEQRAQGKPGAGCTRGPRATKSTGVGPQVNRSIPAFPARWCYGLLRALPGDRALLPPSSTVANLAPASGRQDHTTSPSADVAFVSSQQPRPPHLTATFVTIASRPSFG